MNQENNGENQNLDNNNENQQTELEQLREANALLTNQVNSITGERDKVVGKNKDLINENGSYKEKINNYSNLASDEEDKELLRNGNAQAVFDKQKKAQQKNFDEIMGGANKEIEDLKNEVLGFRNQIKKSEFERAAADYISKTDIKKSAASTFIKLAMEKAELVNGEFVFKDSNGNIKHNSKGQKFTLEDHVNEQRNSNEFFFDIQEGTNAARNGQQQNGVKTYTQEEWQNLYSKATPEQELELDALYDSGKVKVED